MIPRSIELLALDFAFLSFVPIRKFLEVFHPAGVGLMLRLCMAVVRLHFFW